MSADIDLRATEFFFDRIKELADKTGAAVAKVWDDLPGHDETDIPRFTERATPFLTAGATAGAALAIAYLDTIGDDTANTIPDELLAAVPAPDMRHPFIGFWRALTVDRERTAALVKGSGRARRLGRDYVTRAADLVLQQ